MTLTYKISQSLIDRYAAGPSVSRTTQVKNLHENIRAALEGKTFDTFLQGSYRNDTSIADINDVDIVALYDPWASPVSGPDWIRLFDLVADTLSRAPRVHGDISIGDKCVKLSGSPNADIVPAVSKTAYSSADPIRIYSFNARSERDNYPRTHYRNGVTKQRTTANNYKPTVRLFKRWVCQYPHLDAPSFYIECTVHSVNASKFDSYLPLSFVSVGAQILEYTRSTFIPSVAGDKDILVPSEWPPSDFAKFQEHLNTDIQLAWRAVQAPTESEANRLWRRAFGE